jgi:hypothetical protein
VEAASELPCGNGARSPVGQPHPVSHTLRPPGAMGQVRDYAFKCLNGSFARRPGAIALDRAGAKLIEAEQPGAKRKGARAQEHEPLRLCGTRHDPTRAALQSFPDSAGIQHDRNPLPRPSSRVGKVYNRPDECHSGEHLSRKAKVASEKPTSKDALEDEHLPTGDQMRQVISQPLDPLLRLLLPALDVDDLRDQHVIG